MQLGEKCAFAAFTHYSRISRGLVEHRNPSQGKKNGQQRGQRAQSREVHCMTHRDQMSGPALQRYFLCTHVASAGAAAASSS